MFMFIGHLSFAKSLSLLSYLIVFVSKTVFARFTVGFNGFFSLFCQVVDAFWWVPIMVLTEKKSTYICEEHSDRVNKKVFFVVQT